MQGPGAPLLWPEQQAAPTQASCCMPLPAALLAYEPRRQRSPDFSYPIDLIPSTLSFNPAPAAHVPSLLSAWLAMLQQPGERSGVHRSQQ